MIRVQGIDAWLFKYQNFWEFEPEPSKLKSGCVAQKRFLADYSFQLGFDEDECSNDGFKGRIVPDDTSE